MGLFDAFPYTNFHELNADWILDTLRESLETIRNLDSANRAKNAELEKQIKDILAWIDKFDPELVRKIVDEYLVTGVYFSISDAGYFVAHYPQAWDDLEFGTTGLDTIVDTAPEFGHLVLKY